MLHRIKQLITICVLVSTPFFSANALKTKAKQAYLMDFNTGAVLYSKNANKVMTPSSMTKLMTSYVVFSHLKNGNIKLDDTFLVSKKAWKMGGSKSFVRHNAKEKVEDLLKGLIIQSGNDAGVVLAEGISGDEESFADQMTNYARQLGLKKSTFKNATGMPARGHVMTAKELGNLSRRLVMDFPEYFHYFGEKEFTFNKITQPNRNILLGKFGVDGLKTGSTDAGGYGLAATAKRDGRRLVAVVNGLRNERERAAAAKKLLDHGFLNYKNYSFFKAGETIETIRTWYGDSENVPVTARHDIEIVIPAIAKLEDVKATIKYRGPIKAPIGKGEHLADLIIETPHGNQTIELVSKIEVGRSSWIRRIFQNAWYYISR